MPWVVGYQVLSITGAFVSQSTGLDGSIGKTLKKNTIALANARKDRNARIKIPDLVDDGLVINYPVIDEDNNLNSSSYPEINYIQESINLLQ